MAPQTLHGASTGEFLLFPQNMTLCEYGRTHGQSSGNRARDGMLAWVTGSEHEVVPGIGTELISKTIGPNLPHILFHHTSANSDSNRRGHI